MYYDYADTKFCGVFSSFEKALEKREKMVEDAIFITHDNRKYYQMPQDNFEISEEEAQ